MAAFFCSAWSNLHSTQSEIEIDRNLREESEFDFAELAQCLRGKDPSLEKLHKVYTKQAKKWSKRLLDCQKTIHDNHAFYQEGRSIWMKDLATLSKTLQNTRSECQGIINGLLSYISSLESKYYEMLNEIAPFIAASTRNSKVVRPNQEGLSNAIQDFSSSILLLKIHEELRSKIQEIENFHASIGPLKTGQWIREEGAAKIIEKIGKYATSWESTADTTVTYESSEDMNRQLKPADIISNSRPHDDEIFGGKHQMYRDEESDRIPLENSPKFNRNTPRYGASSHINSQDSTEQVNKPRKKPNYGKNQSFIGAAGFSFAENSFSNSINDNEWVKREEYAALKNDRPKLQLIYTRGGDLDNSVQFSSCKEGDSEKQSFASVLPSNKSASVIELDLQSEKETASHKNRSERNKICKVPELDTPRIGDLDLSISTENLRAFTQSRVDSTPTNSLNELNSRSKSPFQKKSSCNSICKSSK